MKLFTQYLWRDEPVESDGSYAGWQSGLRYADGRAKPSLKTFPTPFVLDARARPAVGPGPAPRHDAPSRWSDACAGSSKWRVVATRSTDSRGYWSWSTRLLTGASYRYVAANATSATLKRG